MTRREATPIYDLNDALTFPERVDFGIDDPYEYHDATLAMFDSLGGLMRESLKLAFEREPVDVFVENYGDERGILLKIGIPAIGPDCFFEMNLADALWTNEDDADVLARNLRDLADKIESGEIDTTD